MSIYLSIRFFNFIIFKIYTNQNCWLKTCFFLNQDSFYCFTLFFQVRERLRVSNMLLSIALFSKAKLVTRYIKYCALHSISFTCSKLNKAFLKQKDCHDRVSNFPMQVQSFKFHTFVSNFHYYHIFQTFFTIPFITLSIDIFSSSFPKTLKRHPYLTCLLPLTIVWSLCRKQSIKKDRTQKGQSLSR